jgi:hypothetical protein
VTAGWQERPAIRLARQARTAGKKVFLPAHPGHDNNGFRPDDFFVIPREDGATLRGYRLLQS